MKIRMKYVEQWGDKRRGGAKARFYFRRAGYKRVPLPGLPGSPAFLSAYQSALAVQAEPIGSGRVKPGSIDALVAQLGRDADMARRALTQA